ncbi:glycosyltransferase [Enterococcus viikkiensis]|uniref:glycosyltransferase n=1 Tax=Enterococcus viikkiensis TaxID=930854 RepID=UPI0010F9910E|nr:glycosyltransferase [Enterococcus viikkiensis]
MTTIAHSHNVYSFSLHTIFHKLFTFPTRYISEYFFAPTRLAGEDRYGKKIANGRNFFILKNGFFIDRYLFDLNIRQKTREILKIEKDTKVFIHIGRFSKQKNHKKILSVFKEYVTYNSNAKLLLIGAGKLENEIINYISENDLDSSVHMLGLRQDISQLLMASDLFIFPSLNEGLGIALVEAQTTGLPCVISDVIPQEALLNRESMKVCSLSEDDVEWRKAIDEVLKRPIDREQDFYQVKKLGYDINDVVQMLQKYYEIFSVGDK